MSTHSDCLAPPKFGKHDGMPRVYLAGPMSGIPSYNYPAFDEAASFLRMSGYDVVSPAELDDPETRALAMAAKTGTESTGHSWGEFLARDVRLVADSVDAIVLMPGWSRSRGALLEAYVAILAGKQLSILTAPLEDGQRYVLQVPSSYVRAFL